MLKKIATIAAAVLLLSACKSTPPAKVSLEENIKTNKINVYSLVRQQELEAVVPVQNSSAVSAQFGLVGALVGAAIDSSVNQSNAERANRNLELIRNELLDFPFDSILEQEITKKLQKNQRVTIGSVKTFKTLELLEKAVKNDETFLFLDTYYKMDVNFRTPFLYTSVRLVQNDPKTKENSGLEGKELYKNSFTYFGDTLPIPQKTQADVDKEVAKINADFEALSEDKKKLRKNRKKYLSSLKKARKKDYEGNTLTEKMAEMWGTTYRDQLKENLRVGLQDLFTTIAEDIQDSTPVKSYEKKGVVLKGYPKNHKSILVKETNQRKVIRFTKGLRAGAICSMPNVENTDKLVCL